MKICLIAEGCYPYVVGGVSAWIQMLLEKMPEHQFEIVAIGAEKKQKGDFKYKIPDNVVGIQEYFLDEYLTEVPARRKKRRVELTGPQREAMRQLLRGELRSWEELFLLFRPEDGCPANDFLMSAEYLDIVQQLAEEEYRNTPFKDLFWMVRSMLIPALNLLRCPVPKADLYHTVSTGYAGLLGAKFRYFSQKPLIVTEHGIYTREREEEILKAGWITPYFKPAWISFFRSLSYAAYHEADRIVSLFQGAKELQMELGAPEEKCLVIPNGISMQRFAAVPPIDPNPHPLSIGAVVRVVPIKDIKTMLYSFQRVKAQRPDALLYILGPYDEDPEYYEECCQLIDQLGCPDIAFTGRVDVTQWLGRLDLILLTSISEGQPFVLLEAMAAHRPVVSTNVGSCREIIEGAPDDPFGPAGRVVPVMSPAEIAAGILETGRSIEEMRALAENGYKRVKYYYQDTDFLRRYKALYQELCPGSEQKEGKPWRESALN